uniref:Multidrug and toxin extrusion protein n=1 Tax=Nothobranchius furzeri TaxID=105023 RepID=A0A8C6VZV2_NOTFU
MEKQGSLEPAHPLPGAEPVSGVAKTEGAHGDEATTFASSKLFRCACVKRWLPPAYREELYHVLRLTGPLLLARILNFLLPFVNTIFCGHIGNAELAGFAIASATINVTTTATGYGLALACDTLISQTFGGKNMIRVGVILQRSSLILLLFCLPCWGLLINAHNLLLLLQQEEEVARGMHFFYDDIFLQVSYLQNQGIILPQMYTAAVANIFNLGINYVLISFLKMGAVGSAIANSLSQIVICLLLFGYIRWKKLHKQTWGGWSTDCLQDWGSYMKLAVPSTFMVCFEWWIWEVGGFLAGVLGEVDLAAQHVLLEIGAITYMFPLGVHAAACVRVGNALGAGETSRAIVICKVTLVLSGVLAVFQGFVLAGSKSVVGYIFTTDVCVLIQHIFTFYHIQDICDDLNTCDESGICVCSGILVGSGMQKIAALSNLVSYYIIGLPVGIALMFAAKLRLLGFWIGLLLCVLLQTGFFLFLIFKLNWKKVTQKAQLRAGKMIVVTEPAPKTDGYNPVNTQDVELKATLEFEEKGLTVGGPKREGEDDKNTSNTKAEEKLSISQLITRRGLALLFSILTLTIGVAFHIAFPAPEPSIQSKANFTLIWANDSTPASLNSSF